ncbi:MAG: hypothetical protein KR126chlam6_00286 [Candidatus Anoxychlamydiales bacterium]|nr:hypothetical protein [Candidatus Anoxychlamydiales bacterium]
MNLYSTGLQMGSNVANYFNRKIGFSADEGKETNQYFKPNPFLGSPANGLINGLGKRVVAFGVNNGPSLLLKYGPTVLKNSPLKYFEKVPLVFLALPSRTAVSMLYNGGNVIAHVAAAASYGLNDEGKNHMKIAAKYLYRSAIDFGVFATSSALIGNPDRSIIYAEAILNLVAPDQYRKATNAVFSFIDDRVIGKTDDSKPNAVERIVKRRLSREERENRDLLEGSARMLVNGSRRR